MTHTIAARLPHRTALRIGGPDRVAFLQALISNDIAKVTATAAIHAALLTPQGKFLHDMFVLAHEDSFLIDCEAARADDLLQKLTAYKLRSKVTFENLSEHYDIWAEWNGASAAPLSYPDPRLPQMGYRAFIPKTFAPPHCEIASFVDWDTQRLTQGIADGSRDLDIEKSTLAEGNFDYLNGIDWKKGCYVGQELTARMHYRGLAKKRLFPVHIEGETGPATAILSGDTETGQMRSQRLTNGLALLNLDAAQASMEQNVAFTCGNAKIYPSRPGWMPQKE